jgi:integrase
VAPYRKRIRRRDGTVTTSKSYYIRFRFNGRIHRPAALPSHTVSAELERNIKRLVHYRQANLEPDGGVLAWLEGLGDRWVTYLTRIGVLDAQSSPSRLVWPLVTAYVQSKRDAECTPGLIKLVAMHLHALLEGIGAQRVNDIKAESVQRWLADQRRQRDHRTNRRGFSAATRNHYLKDVKAFCNWLVRENHLRRNPVAQIAKLNEKADPRHARRAYTVDELRVLLNITNQAPTRWGMTGTERALLYQFTAETGCRAAEVRSLTRSSFNLTGSFPTVTITAAQAKARRSRVIPLRAETAQVIQPLVRDLGLTDPVFRLPSLYNVVRMLRDDLTDAGIPYEDDQGRVRDFHALRRTFATMLRAADVHPKVAQTLLGHSTIALTMDLYTDVDRTDLAAAVAALPDLASGPGRSFR